jgi:hypothetical protein
MLSFSFSFPGNTDELLTMGRAKRRFPVLKQLCTLPKLLAGKLFDAAGWVVLSNDHPTGIINIAEGAANQRRQKKL